MVFAAPNRLLVIAPSLPLSAPDPGVDLQDLTAAGTTVDIAVFTQGGAQSLVESMRITV